ncbi:MAG TPA: hypothetical protein VFJ87_04830 [Rhodanobacteraceae bacterium]|nr:hypothetical protein [Rhodanobacteraceae bacterium]
MRAEAQAGGATEATATLGPFCRQRGIRMRFVGLKPVGDLLRAVNTECISDCDGVLAAIPYAEKGRPEILLFDDCLREKKPLHFYGRSDGTCPVDLPPVAVPRISRKSVG